MPQPAATTARARADWADIAKGASIVGVVLLHVTGAYAREVCGVGAAAKCTHWGDINQALTPMRVPLFFAISGFFAHRALTRDWGEVLRPRVFNQLYVYFLWTVLFAGVMVATDSQTSAGAIRALERSWVTSGAYWYISALAVFFVVAKLTMRLPAWLMIAFGAALVLATPPIWEAINDNGDVDTRLWRLTFYFVYFLIGARFTDVLSRCAEAGRKPLVFGVALTVVAGLDIAYALSDKDTALRLAVSVSAVFGGAAIAMGISSLAAARWFGRVVGRRTLGVYLLQALINNVITERVADHFAPQLRQHHLLAVLFPPVVTVAVVVATLAIYETALRLGLRWLFHLPGGRTRRQKSEPVGQVAEEDEIDAGLEAEPEEAGPGESEPGAPGPPEPAPG